MNPVKKGDYSLDSSIFRTFNNDSKHKLWFVLDNNLVLPEYMVEFEYKKGNDQQNNIIKVGDTLCMLESTDKDQ